MDAGRFDRFSRSLAHQLSRRTAIRATGLAGAVGVAALSGLDARAQDGTPDATPSQLADDAMFLFVQSATSGTFVANTGAGTPTADGTPVAGGGADYLLTLEGHTGSTIYFSDRPDRIFGSSPTQAFLDGLGFAPDDPPNAALVTNDAGGNEDVLVVELIDPAFDAETGTVTYGVNILSDYEGGLDFVAGRQGDEDLAPTFGAASLFIDDCSDSEAACKGYDPGTQQDQCIGNITIGRCWDWGSVSCRPCRDYSQLCNDTYSQCNGGCVDQTDRRCY